MSNMINEDQPDEQPNEQPNEQPTFEVRVKCVDSIRKKVGKQKNTGIVYLPANWIDAEVLIIRLKDKNISNRVKTSKSGDLKN